MGRSFGAMGEKKACSFLKKRTKKFFVLRVVAAVLPGPAGAKVFLVLFLQKKNVLLSRFESG
jgi:hypothetical protein